MSTPKIISFYLPQYYPFKENNQFWGEGFTEWDNVKSSRTFFHEHQIKKPNSYYDLRDFDVRKQQSDKAKDAGIYGFCYYHFWFSSHPGKKVMYEVLEKMLEDGQPDMPFCLEWANEPWTKRWDGLEHEYLIKQDYGNKSEWKDHFEYLLKFFKHPNYILVDNKPMFLIYRIGHIGDKFKYMQEYWNQLAKENGFDGVHFLQIMNSFVDTKDFFNPNVEGYVEYNPMWINRFTTPLVVDKNMILHSCKRKWKAIEGFRTDLLPGYHEGKRLYRGTYTGWDSSPRALGRQATIDIDDNPEDFEDHLKIMLMDIQEEKDPYLFLFAWNEWGEGAVIEEDSIRKNGILRAIKNAMQMY